MKVNHITSERDGGLVQGDMMDCFNFCFVFYATAEKTRSDQLEILKQLMNDMDAEPELSH